MCGFPNSSMILRSWKAQTDNFRASKTANQQILRSSEVPRLQNWLMLGLGVSFLLLKHYFVDTYDHGWPHKVKVSSNKIIEILVVRVNGMCLNLQQEVA